MVNVLPKVPRLPRATTAPLSLESLASFQAALNTALFREFADHAQRVNAALMKDGTEAMTGPLVTKAYATADVPSASSWTNGIITVSDAAKTVKLYWSNGTNWICVLDGTTL